MSVSFQIWAEMPTETGGYQHTLVAEGDLTKEEIAGICNESEANGGKNVSLRTIDYRSESYGPDDAPFGELLTRAQERTVWSQRRGEPARAERVHRHDVETRCDGTLGCITVM